MDARNLTIAVLTLTAAILFVGLVLVNAFPQSAMAYGQGDRAGDYVVATGQLQNSTELVYITDAAIGRLNVYLLDISKQYQLRLVDTFDLATRLRAPARSRTGP